MTTHFPPINLYTYRAALAIALWLALAQLSTPQLPTQRRVDG